MSKEEVKKEIESCPFCGNNPFEGRIGDGRYSIKCYECGVEMIHDRKDKLRETWNNRDKYAKEVAIDFWNYMNDYKDEQAEGLFKMYQQSKNKSK